MKHTGMHTSTLPKKKHRGLSEIFVTGSNISDNPVHDAAYTFDKPIPFQTIVTVQVSE
jgi:hypothetical protein